MTKGSNLTATLEDFALDINLAAKRTLGTRTIGKNKSYGSASGALRRSLTFKVAKIRGKSKILFSSPLPYAAFIHWGVNGTHKNRQAPYSYTNKQPPISAVRKWMKAKPIRLRDKDGRFVKQTESGLNSAAFRIARAIKRNGIHGLRYYEKALESVLPRYEKKLASAVVDDFISQLSFTAGNIKVNMK